METMSKPTKKLLDYTWTKREYHETELFELNHHAKNYHECLRHRGAKFNNRRQSENPSQIERENLIEKRNIEQTKDDNVFREISGRMSALGQLGTHKYRNHSTKDWTSRTMHICEDIEP